MASTQKKRKKSKRSRESLEKRNATRRQKRAERLVKAEVGRPTKFQPGIVEHVLGLIGTGVPAQHAAPAAGVAYRTFRDWILKSEEYLAQKDAIDASAVMTPQEKAAAIAALPNAEYEDFSEAVKAAEGQFMATNLIHIQKEAPKTWQAAAWLLERTHPELFGRQRVELSGPGGKPISVTASPDELLRERLEQIEESLRLTQAATETIQ